MLRIENEEMQFERIKLSLKLSLIERILEHNSVQIYLLQLYTITKNATPNKLTS